MNTYPSPDSIPQSGIYLILHRLIFFFSSFPGFFFSFRCFVRSSGVHASSPLFFRLIFFGLGLGIYLGIRVLGSALFDD